MQILFLNKNDLFEKKVVNSDIKNFFPVSGVHLLSPRRIRADELPLLQDYDGESNDAKAGREYFKKRFARLAQKANAPEREIYIQYVHIFFVGLRMFPCLRTSRTDCTCPSVTTATDTAMLRVVMAAVEGA